MEHSLTMTWGILVILLLLAVIFGGVVALRLSSIPYRGSTPFFPVAVEPRPEMRPLWLLLLLIALFYLFATQYSRTGNEVGTDTQDYHQTRAPNPEGAIHPPVQHRIASERPDEPHFIQLDAKTNALDAHLRNCDFANYNTSVRKHGDEYLIIKVLHSKDAAEKYRESNYLRGPIKPLRDLED